MHLVWRRYRDARLAPVPVVKAVVRVSYAYTETAPHAPPTGLRGTVEAASSVAGLAVSVETAASSKDPVLVRYEEGTSPEGFVYDVVGAPPVTLDMSAEPALLVPGMRKPGPERTRLVQAVPVRTGLFRIERGFPRLAAVKKDGELFAGRISYRSAYGLVYLEEDETPVPATAHIEVSVDERVLEREPLWGLSDGRHPVTADGVRGAGPVIGYLTKTTDRGFVDVRKLPVPETALQDHVVDYGYYDGGPVSTGHLWIIKTDAPRDRVEAAVRRTLPAGCVYRVEPLTGSSVKAVGGIDA